jgi:protein TonB
MRSALNLPPYMGGSRLPTWAAISLLAHVVILSIGRAAPPQPESAEYRPITADIVRLDAHPTTPLELAQDKSSSVKADVVNAQNRARTGDDPARMPKTVSSTNGLFLNAYFSQNDVEIRAEPINEVYLYYPLLAYQKRLSGVVQFKLYIDSSGKIDRIEMLDASPRGLFEEAAWNAVRKLQFRPATKNGKPVKSQKTIDVVFDPNDDFLAPARSAPSPSAAGT